MSYSNNIFGEPENNQSVGEHTQYTAPSFSMPLSEMEDSVQDEERATKRTFVSLHIFVVFIIVILASQSFRLQVTEGKTNRAQAEGNSLRLITIPAERGLITDDKGVTLAQNTRQLALAISPQSLPAKKSDRQTIYALLQQKAGISDAVIQSIEKNETSNFRSSETFPIKTDLSKDESLLYKEWFANTPGVILQEVPIRNYAALGSLGQIVGYDGFPTDDDLKNGVSHNQPVGKTGLEQVYNQYLSGKAGKQQIEVNAQGDTVRTLPITPDNAAQPGQTLKLSLDSRLQQIVTTALQHELDRRKEKFGTLPTFGASAVFLDPSNGAVKAMVSLPDFDPNKFAQGISQKEYSTIINDPAHPLVNRTIQGLDPSGSVIKPLEAAAGLQTGTITTNTQMVTPDAIHIGNFSFADWKTHGLTNVFTSISESNDIWYYALVGGWAEKNFQGMGIETVNQYLRKFGLGQATGIDLPGEADGLLADPAWKLKNVGEPWYIGDTYHSAIGQGYVLVTPLQMAVATAAIANGGTVYKPQLADSTIDPVTGKATSIPHTVLNKDFISPQNIAAVQQGMRATVVNGSGHYLNDLNVASAGKTGTAENNDVAHTHAWYTGYAPYDHPEIAFSIMIEGGGESFYSSEIVAKEILAAYYNDTAVTQDTLTSEAKQGNPEFAGEH